MIVIVDYGMGNLRSVQKGFEKVGYEADDLQRPGRDSAGDEGRACRASARFPMR